MKREQAMNLVLEWIELRGRARPRVLRRLGTSERPAHGLAMQAEAPGELADPDVLAEVQTPQLGPLLHDQHVLPPDPIWTSPGQGGSGGRSGDVAGVGHLSTAVRGAVLERRRHTRGTQAAGAAVSWISAGRNRRSRPPRGLIPSADRGVNCSESLRWGVGK